MSGLPANLALVGRDLARATLRDAKRSRRRRRLAFCAVACALLALSATAAGAGWLFGHETPVVRVVPALGGAPVRGTGAPGGADSAAQDVTRLEAQHRAQQAGARASPALGQLTVGSPRILLAGLGAQHRLLTSTATTSGGVCLTLTGFGTQCVPTFARDQNVVWFFRSAANRTTVVWGLVTGAVTALEAVTTGGTTVPAVIANGGFYADSGDGPPARLIVHLDDGGTQTVQPLACPLAAPDCSP